MCKRYRFVLFLCLLSLLVGTVGCAQQQSGRKFSDDDTHVYEKVSDNFLIDADIIQFPKDTVPKVYEGIFQTYTQAQAEAFCATQGATVDSWEYAPNSYEHKYFTTDSNGGYVFFSNDFEGTFTSEFQYDRNEVRSGEVYPIYVTQEDYDTSAILRFAHLFTEPKDFAFATAQEAETDVRDALATLGLNNLFLNRILYVDHETLAKCNELIRDPYWDPIKPGVTNANITDWSEDDDTYLFEFFPTIHDSPLFHADLRLDTGRYFAAYATVWYHRSGIIQLRVYGAFLPGDMVEEPESCISAAEALDFAVTKLSNVLTYKDTVISRISGSYYYIQDGDRYLLKPVWVVTAQYSDVLISEFSDIRSCVYVILDAITGEEL